MIVTTTDLDNWADSGTLESEASNLKTHGSDFKTAVSNAKSSWDGLSSCYHTPHEDLLYSALDVPVTASQDVGTGTETIKTAITTFTSTASALETERTSLLAEVEAHNATPEACTSNSDGTELICKPVTDNKGNSNAVGDSEGLDLQIRVNDLAQRYQDAVDTCVNSLNAIQEDGTQGDPLSPLLKYVRGRIMAAAGIAAEGIKVVKTRYYSQQTIQFGERSVKLKPALVRESSEYFFDIFNKHRVGPEPQGFWGRFGSRFKSSFVGPSRGVWSEPKFLSSVTRDGATDAWSSTTKVGVSAVGRTLGRGLFAAGALLNYKSEYDSAKTRYENQPGLTTGQANAKARESAFVRTVGQVGTTAAVTAAACSVVPGIGTAAGFAIGSAVGAVTMLPTGGGKNVGDRIGDASEGIYNGGKKLFKKVFG